MNRIDYLNFKIIRDNVSRHNSVKQPPLATVYSAWLAGTTKPPKVQAISIEPKCCKFCSLMVADFAAEFIS